MTRGKTMRHNEIRHGLVGLALSVAAIPGVVLWCLTVTSISLVLLTLGIPATLAAFAGVRRYADRHRRWVGEFTGVPVPRPYRPTQQGGWLPMFRAVLRDPANWRDLGWLLVNGTVGLALAVIPGSLLLATCWYLALPVIYLAGGTDVLVLKFGLFTVHDLPTSFLGWIFAAVCYGLLRWVGGPALRLYAALTRALLAPTARTQLDQRVLQLTESRSETIDSQAAELRRIERDLHDGAQARLVSLGLNLAMAEKLMATDPTAAAELLNEAVRSTGTALAELRDLVHGIHPPMLADRGIEAALRALAMASAIPVETTIELPGRPPAPVESAMYFAVAEALANLIKHSGATEAWLRMEYGDGRLRTSVGDDGRGGAAIRPDGGLHGIERRLAAFDGTLYVSSPLGGPTILTMELPCALSLAKTSPYSGTA